MGLGCHPLRSRTAQDGLPPISPRLRVRPAALHPFGWPAVIVGPARPDASSAGPARPGCHPPRPGRCLARPRPGPALRLGPGPGCHPLRPLAGAWPAWPPAWPGGLSAWPGLPPSSAPGLAWVRPCRPAGAGRWPVPVPAPPFSGPVPVPVVPVLVLVLVPARPGFLTVIAVK